eukprot:GEMP01068313.1.p1 GENE.GEMP01068313.1~~GEMP01068313.1.p1  ORF type:complete len:126 (+),score=24.99 GEMP01068313.1:515-892(+)
MTLKAVDEEIFNTQKKDRRKFLVHLPDQRLWFQCQIGVHKNDTNNPKISTEMVCVPKQEVNRKWCRWIGMDKKNWTGFRTICLGGASGLLTNSLFRNDRTLIGRAGEEYPLDWVGKPYPMATYFL